ncbi:MAG: hypothetical protein ABI378_16020 [Chitinophagaceae bacterium]
MKSRNLIARLLGRAANISAETHLPPQTEKSASAAPPIDVRLLQSPSAGATAPLLFSNPGTDSGLEQSGTFLMDQDPNEPPLICWKHKLYRQKVVDGGLEPYGAPVGDC